MLTYSGSVTGIAGGQAGPRLNRGDKLVSMQDVISITERVASPAVD